MTVTCESGGYGCRGSKGVGEDHCIMTVTCESGGYGCRGSKKVEESIII